MLKIGVSIVVIEGKTSILNYHIVNYGKDGFADANVYLPYPCDLLEMKTNTNKIRIGWWTGQEFYGIRLKENEKVIAWKKKKELL